MMMALCAFTNTDIYTKTHTHTHTHIENETNRLLYVYINHIAEKYMIVPAQLIPCTRLLYLPTATSGDSGRRLVTVAWIFEGGRQKLSTEEDRLAD